MKNKKLLSLIIIAPILASCSSSKIRDVKFESYANKVDYASFVKSLSEIKPFYLTSDSLKSYSFTSFEDQKMEYSQHRDNNEKYLNLYIYNDDFSGGYDSSKSTYLSNEKYYKETKIKTDSLDSTLTSEKQKRYQYQQSIVNDVNSVVEVDLNNQKYSVETVVSPLSSVELTAKQQLIELAVPSIEDYARFTFLSDEEKQYFSFYVDNNIFTITYLKDYDDNEYVKTDDKVKAKAHIYKETTWQYVYTDSEVKNLMQSKSEITLTALEDMSYELKSLRKNDQYFEKEYCSQSSEIKVEEYSLDAVDLSSYVNM